MPEHPFAPFVRILGKGPHLSRPLTLDEARAAGRMIMDGAVEPEQLGAFLCLLRVKIETPDELAGLALAVRESMTVPSPRPAVDIDWPSYAGKARRAPLFILAALLLAQNGLSIAMHGTEGHTAGRVYTEETLARLGVPAATSLTDAAGQLARRHFTFMPLGLLHPRLPDLMELKWLLGVRSPLHSVLRHVNPFDARLTLVSVFHPNYRPLHRDAALAMGQRDIACFKGDGGEVERRPEKPCLVEGLRDGCVFSEEWPPTLDMAGAGDSPLDPDYLAGLWRGACADPLAEAAVTGTAALVLRCAGRAGSFAEAEALARKLWAGRRRDGGLAA